MSLQGNEGWSFRDVLPYFKKSENNLDESFAADKEYHAVGGYQSVSRFPYQDHHTHALLEGFKEIGLEEIDYNAGGGAGVMLTQATQEKGKRRGTSRAFLSPVLQRKNLKVITGGIATKILIHPENKTAYGVEYILESDRNTKYHVLFSKEVIVSSGAINSPQLLMLSGIGPRETLEKLGIKVIQDLKVGRNLQDHSGSSGVQYSLNDSCLIEKGQIQDDLSRYSYQKSGPFSAVGTVQVVAFNSSSHANYPDIQFHALPIIEPGLVAEDENDVAFDSYAYYNKIILHSAVLRPTSRGYVTINSTDPLQPPLIFNNLIYSERDIDIAAEGCKFAARLGETRAFREAGMTLDTTRLAGCTEFEHGTADYWKCTARLWLLLLPHAVGTCKMGPPSDAEAVVNSELKVYGVKGLRVADASIMPYIVSGNTNAPVIMVGEKCSDLVKEEWKPLNS
jgi:choline dehydrogenase-like flavoprotein